MRANYRECFVEYRVITVRVSQANRNRAHHVRRSNDSPGKSLTDLDYARYALCQSLGGASNAQQRATGGTVAFSVYDRWQSNCRDYQLGGLALIAVFMSPKFLNHVLNRLQLDRQTRIKRERNRQQRLKGPTVVVLFLDP